MLRPYEIYFIDQLTIGRWASYAEGGQVMIGIESVIHCTYATIWSAYAVRVECINWIYAG